MAWDGLYDALSSKFPDLALSSIRSPHGQFTSLVRTLVHTARALGLY